MKPIRKSFFLIVQSHIFFIYLTFFFNGNIIMYFFCGFWGAPTCMVKNENWEETRFISAVHSFFLHNSAAFRLSVIGSLISKFWLQFPTQKNSPFPMLSDTARANGPGFRVHLTNVLWSHLCVTILFVQIWCKH